MNTVESQPVPVISKTLWAKLQEHGLREAAGYYVLRKEFPIAAWECDSAEFGFLLLNKQEAAVVFSEATIDPRKRCLLDIGAEVDESKSPAEFESYWLRIFGRIED